MKSPTILGSDFQKVVYPADYKRFVSKGSTLERVTATPAMCWICKFVANTLRRHGRRWARVFDVANIDDKDISQRVITARFRHLGRGSTSRLSMLRQLRRRAR